MVSKKIVLSDSPELVSALEGSFFHREGFVFLLARQGSAAYHFIEEEAPAMAILDLAVHADEGMACCRRVKQDPLLAGTPLLMVTPQEDDGALAEACWQAGGDAVVARPLEAARLLDAACGLLGINRRLARRFPVAFQLAFAAPGLREHTGSAINFNVGGMFIATEKLYPFDTRLDLHFTLPGYSTPLTCKARVAWVNHPEWRKKTGLPCGMGVQFLPTGPNTLASLQAFLHSLKW